MRCPIRMANPAVLNENASIANMECDPECAWLMETQYGEKMCVMVINVMSPKLAIYPANTIPKSDKS